MLYGLLIRNWTKIFIRIWRLKWNAMEKVTGIGEGLHINLLIHIAWRPRVSDRTKTFLRYYFFASVLQICQNLSLIGMAVSHVRVWIKLCKNIILAFTTTKRATNRTQALWRNDFFSTRDKRAIISHASLFRSTVSSRTQYYRDCGVSKPRNGLARASYLIKVCRSRHLRNVFTECTFRARLSLRKFAGRWNERGKGK